MQQTECRQKWVARPHAIISTPSSFCPVRAKYSPEQESTKTLQLRVFVCQSDLVFEIIFNLQL